jgi:hypothetical protein
VSQPRPPGEPLFIAIDLDNLDGYDLGAGPDVPDRGVARMLEEIQRLAGARIQEGFAAMNSRTKTRLPTDLLNVLDRWKVRVVEVPAGPEAADKEIFYALGRAGAVGFRRFVIVSKDKGFADAVRRLRDDQPAATIHVVLDQATSGVRDFYGPIGGIQFIELTPRSSQPMPVPVPLPDSPKPDTGTGANVPGREAKPKKKAPRSAPRVQAAVEAHPQYDYVLVCDLCGWRSLQRAAAKNSRCRVCGAAMRTARVFFSKVFPPGRRPFDDGPVIEFWFRGLLRRTAVLCSQSMAFGRSPDPLGQDTVVPLGDLVAARNRLSREQFLVVKEGSGRCALIPTGDRPMFLADGDKLPGKALPQNQRVELSHGQEFWINDRSNSNDSGALLRCVFLTAPREAAARGAKS